MRPLKIVCLGDSLTEGYQIKQGTEWSNLLQQELNIDIINSGISGDTTGGMLARFQYMVIEHKPTHVIIMGGVNDLSLNLSDNLILSNLLAMTRYASYHGIEPIVGIPTPFYWQHLSYTQSIYLDYESLGKRLEVLQTKTKQFATEGQLKYIDFSTDMPQDLFLADGIHPNEKGHQMMMQNALHVVKEL
ncbi:MAG: GDSL-type esterase/lipase family protein [Cyclobacteriaceae bacterium]|nr:GDSL-type esterase/lipase family protein [Cyclobacteriaceae bacterium]